MLTFCPIEYVMRLMYIPNMSLDDEPQAVMDNHIDWPGRIKAVGLK